MTTSSPSTAGTSADLQERLHQRAYYLWLDAGQPHGRDLEHWDAAVREVGAAGQPSHAPATTPPEGLAPSLSIRHTLDAHLADPTHRFHQPGPAHDARLDVVAGEARQRVRSRSSNLQPRKAAKDQK